MSAPRLVTIGEWPEPHRPYGRLTFLGRPVAWKDVVRRCLPVADLLAEARRWRRFKGEMFCANAVWYGERAGYQNHEGLKPRLEELVGWWSGCLDPVLRSAEAYDVAYNTIYDALPDCRGICACSGGPSLEPWDSDYQRTRREWQRMQKHVAPLIFERDGHACAECGSSADLTVDHIVPIVSGGTNSLRNFTTLCRSCNSRKGAQ